MIVTKPHWQRAFQATSGLGIRAVLAEQPQLLATEEPQGIKLQSESNGLGGGILARPK